MFRHIKDAAVTKGFKAFVNSRIKAYGTMLTLDLDSKLKQINFEMILEGEEKPIALHVSRYELCEEKGKYVLKVYGVTSSRAWITTLAGELLEGKAFEIPAEYAKMLKMVV